MVQFPLNIDVSEGFDNKWMASIRSPELASVSSVGPTKEYVLGSVFLMLSRYPGFHVWTFNIMLHSKTETVHSVLPVNEDCPIPSVFEMETYKTNGKMGSIKAYRERTGLGLREAKEAVEAEAKRLGL